MIKETGKLRNSFKGKTTIIRIPLPTPVINPYRECGERKRYPRIIRSRKEIKLSVKIQKILNKELRKIIKCEVN